MKQLLGVNYYLHPSDGNDAVFHPERSCNPCSPFLCKFKQWIEERYDVEVHTPDLIDWSKKEAVATLFFNYSWRYCLADPFIKRIPREKRALMLIEPSNVNPSLYYLSFFRNKFSTVFTWDLRLLHENPGYIPINVPVGAEPMEYRYAKQPVPFSQKKLLVAISRNRWSYMPTSTYKDRIRAYAFFDKTIPSDFDLFGYGWNRPATRIQTLLGYQHFKCYKGPITGDHWRSKVAKMAEYKFALCYENNISQPGYISEKILDCICARCVPIYYGSPGVENRIPKSCWIDAKMFSTLDDMLMYIKGITETEHSKKLEAMDAFLNSEACEFFSTEHYFRTLATGLTLPLITGS